MAHMDYGGPSSGIRIGYSERVQVSVTWMIAFRTGASLLPCARPHPSKAGSAAPPGSTEGSTTP